MLETAIVLLISVDTNTDDTIILLLKLLETLAVGPENVER
jgi:hypothetical protein